MDEIKDQLTSDDKPRMNVTSLRSVKAMNAVLRVQKVASVVVLLNWTVAIVIALILRAVNDIVFAMIVVGAIAFVARITARFWSDLCTGEWEISEDRPRRDLVAFTSILAFICFWSVSIITVGFGLALVLWVGLLKL
jgi:hypothetical protein